MAGGVAPDPDPTGLNSLVRGISDLPNLELHTHSVNGAPTLGVDGTRRNSATKAMLCDGLDQPKPALHP
jgi:hypothetical protein